MLNLCNCIQPMPYSHLFSSLAIVFGAEFCYTTGNYFIEFTQSDSRGTSEKEKKRQKKQKKQKCATGIERTTSRT